MMLSKALPKLIALGMISFVFFSASAQEAVQKRPTPPAEATKFRSDCPPGYIWKRDHWKWNKRSQSYEWTHGECVRIKKGHMWIQGHWTRISEGYIWKEGHWKRI